MYYFIPNPPQRTITVLEKDHPPLRIGLVDADGNHIIRYWAKEPIGFIDFAKLAVEKQRKLLEVQSKNEENCQ